MSKNNRATNPIRNVKVSRRDILRGTAVAAAAGTAVPVGQDGRPNGEAEPGRHRRASNIMSTRRPARPSAGPFRNCWI